MSAIFFSTRLVVSQWKRHYVLMFFVSFVERSMSRLSHGVRPCRVVSTIMFVSGLLEGMGMGSSIVMKVSSGGGRDGEGCHEGQLPHPHWREE